MIRRRWEALPIAWQYAATVVMCAVSFAVAFALTSLITGTLYDLSTPP